jgi:hypothetical protein
MHESYGRRKCTTAQVRTAHRDASARSVLPSVDAEGRADVPRNDDDSGGRRRRLVADSWARSEAMRLAPDRIEVASATPVAEVEDGRRSHALAAAVPVIRSLLVRDAVEDGGLVVTVADAAGRLLWVEGAPRALARAEPLGVVPGADWSETSAGTNAPGTALALDATVQIAGSEHFALQAQQLSCTAVPIRDLDTRETIGVLDITGGPAAVGDRSVALLEATVAAAERELLLQRLLRGEVPPVPTAAPTPAPSAHLAVLGRNRAELSVAGRSTTLSLRHAEVLTLLAWHRGGLSAERLAELVHGRPDPAAVRPEMTRLRRLLAGVAPSLVPLTRPYRLPAPIGLDARDVVTHLDRGANRAALEGYAGEVLPASVAPGILDIRAEVSGHLREALLQTGSPDLLLRYADTVVPADPVPLTTALQLLPQRSSQRAGVVSRLAALA